ELGTAMHAALAPAQPLATHLYAERGPVNSDHGSLLTLALGELLLTRLEAEGKGVALTLLNPTDGVIEAVIGAAKLRPRRASRTTLSGAPLEPLPCDGEVRVRVAPRAWTR